VYTRGTREPRPADPWGSGEGVSGATPRQVAGLTAAGRVVTPPEYAVVGGFGDILAGLAGIRAVGCRRARPDRLEGVVSSFVQFIPRLLVALAIVIVGFVIASFCVARNPARRRERRRPLAALAQ